MEVAIIVGGGQYSGGGNPSGRGAILVEVAIIVGGGQLLCKEE